MEITLIYNERTGNETARVYTQLEYETQLTQRVEQQFGKPHYKTKSDRTNCACVMGNGQFKLVLTPLNAKWIKSVTTKHRTLDGEITSTFDYQNPADAHFVDELLRVGAPGAAPESVPTADAKPKRPRTASKSKSVEGAIDVTPEPVATQETVIAV